MFAALLFVPLRARVQAASACTLRSPQRCGQQSTPEAQSPEKNQQERGRERRVSPLRHGAALGAKLGMNAEQAATAFTVTNFRRAGNVARLVPGEDAAQDVSRPQHGTIQKHLVDARTATEEASARLNSVEERPGKLDEQIAAMRAQAEKDSARDEQRIKAAVEEEKQKILAAAEQEIAAATMQRSKQIQQYAAELAIEQAARKLVVTAETDRLLVQGFAQRLTGDETKEGQN